MAAIKNRESSARILVGKIAAAHGIRGLVKIFINAEDPELLNNKPLFTDKTGEDRITLALRNPLGKYRLAAVEGISDRDAAEALAGTELWIARESLPAIKAGGEFYVADLIGMEIRNIAGEPVGILKGVDNFGAGDLLDIKPLKGHNFYLPFTRQNVPEIDIENRTLTIDPPEGLLN